MQIGLIFITVLRAEEPPAAVAFDERAVDTGKSAEQILVMGPRPVGWMERERRETIRAMRLREAEQLAVSPQEKRIRRLRRDPRLRHGPRELAAS